MKANDTILTIADLATWHPPGGAFAVLGQPIRHSVSPAMHNAALADAAKSDPRWRGWAYFRFEVPPTDLSKALPLLHDAGFTGLNLTVPHKVLACDLVEAVDSSASDIGAVNTLLRTSTGWKGYNTDGYGLATGLETTLGLRLTGSDVILLGAGGAARGAAVQCIKAGVQSLWIANRTEANLIALLDLLRPIAEQRTTLHGFNPSRPPSDIPRGAIMVNATSAGLKTADPLPIDPRHLPRPRAVYDMIYNPPETLFLKSARELGIPCSHGLSMLVHQGAKSLEIWTEIPASRSAPIMETAAKAALGLT